MEDLSMEGALQIQNRTPDGAGRLDLVNVEYSSIYRAPRKLSPISLGVGGIVSTVISEHNNADVKINRHEALPVSPGHL